MQEGLVFAATSAEGGAFVVEEVGRMRTEHEAQADALVDDAGATTFSVVLPFRVREEIERLAFENHRTAGAVVRLALCSWLENERGKAHS